MKVSEQLVKLSETQGGSPVYYTGKQCYVIKFENSSTGNFQWAIDGKDCNNGEGSRSNAMSEATAVCPDDEPTVQWYYYDLNTNQKFIYNVSFVCMDNADISTTTPSPSTIITSNTTTTTTTTDSMPSTVPNIMDTGCAPCLTVLEGELQGVYTLQAEGDPRCQDGCRYTDQHKLQYCFIHGGFKTELTCPMLP